MLKNIKRLLIKNSGNSILKRCKKCNKWKCIEKFSKSEGCKNQCKPCKTKNYNKWLNDKFNKLVQESIHNGFFKDNEFERLAANLLAQTCYRRWKDCKYNKPGYENVNCPYPSYEAFFYECLTVPYLIDDLFYETEIFIESGFNTDYKPCIDRINGDGHYTLDNIQILNVVDNRDKALKESRVPCLVVIFNGQTYQAIKFASITECNKGFKQCFGINALRKFDSNNPYVKTLDDGTVITIQPFKASINGYSKNPAGYDLENDEFVVSFKLFGTLIDNCGRIYQDLQQFEAYKVG